MDTKKNLKPELKEIYERVMNTTATARPTPPSDTKPTNPPPAQTPELKKSDAPAVTPTPPPSPAASTEPFLASSAPRAVNDSSGFVFSSHGKNMPQQDKKKEEQVEKKPEVHVEKKMEKPEAKGEKQPDKIGPESGKKKSNLLPMVLILMTIFLVVYTLFWAFFLGII